MKIKQTIVTLAAVIGISGLFLSPAVFAADDGGSNCGVKTAIIKCPAGTSDSNANTDISKTAAGSLLVMAIQIMTAGVGVLAVGGIVYGAVLYASAGGSAEQVKKARTIITNVVIGIVAYGLMYVILNFIIPGGLFQK